MRRYVLRRVLLIVPTLLLLGTILFFMLRVVPGDVADSLAGGSLGSLDPEEAERLREDLGLNSPVIVQYGRWLSTTAQGDLGFSPSEHRPVLDALLSKVETTLSLTILAVFLSVIWAVPLGVLSALYRGSWIDQVIRVVTASGLAMPNFWIGIVVLLLLVRIFDWSPPVQHVSIFDEPWTAFQRLVFPALVIGYRFAAVISRLTRSAMLEVINEDYIRTARAKGLSPFIVVRRHALVNALLPVLTITTVLFGTLLEGAVVIEQIFVLPGVGRLLIDAVNLRDFFMVQGIILALGAVLILWILLVDLAYAWLDPRIHYE